MLGSHDAVRLSERQPAKRKLEDYFRPGPTAIDTFKSATTTSTSTKRSRIDTQTPTSKPEYPPGLTVIPNFVTRDEESSILNFLSTQRWRTDLSRRVIHYGGTYCLMPPRTATLTDRKKIESTILTADPIPPTLDYLLDRMIQHNLYDVSRKPTFCIVNEYIDSTGISAHVENFRFDEPVCGLTLNQGDFIRFHELCKADDGSVRSGLAAKAERTGRKVDVWMERGSLLVMRGESRWKWQHEIVRKKRGLGFKRVSLTFRCLREGQR